MHRSSITIFLIAVIIIGLLGLGYITGIIPSGKSADNVQTGTDVNAGRQTVPTISTQLSLTTFEEALDQLQRYLRSNPESSNFRLHYVRAKDLDYQGRAAQWVFGVRYADQSVLMYFDNPGWQSVPWEGAAPEQEISMGSLVTPKSAIGRNTALLSGGDPVEKILIQRMELMNGKYILTIGQQGHPQIFVIDATSGEVIPNYA